MNRKLAMIDLETMGLRKTSAILAIGAVEFDSFGDIGEMFYQNIDLQSCLDWKMTMDDETATWWNKNENAAAYKMLLENTVPLHKALADFRAWLLRDCNHDRIEVWCNGASFDFAILETAYSLVDIPHPWVFYNEMDYRTLKNLFRSVPKPEFNGTKHYALHDAIFQATHLCDITKHMHEKFRRAALYDDNMHANKEAACG